MKVRDLNTLGRIVLAIFISAILIFLVAVFGYAFLPSAKGFFDSLFSFTALIILSIVMYLLIEFGVAATVAAEEKAEKIRQEKENAAARIALKQREEKEKREKQEILAKAKRLKPEIRRNVINLLKASPGTYFSKNQIWHQLDLHYEASVNMAFDWVMDYFWRNPNSAEGIKRVTEPQGSYDPEYYYYYEKR